MACPVADRLNELTFLALDFRYGFFSSMKLLLLPSNYLMNAARG